LAKLRKKFGIHKYFTLLLLLFYITILHFKLGGLPAKLSSIYKNFSKTQPAKINIFKAALISSAKIL